MTVLKKRNHHWSNFATHGPLLLDYITCSPLRASRQRRPEAKTERCSTSWVGRQALWGSTARHRLHIGCRFCPRARGEWHSCSSAVCRRVDGRDISSFCARRSGTEKRASPRLSDGVHVAHNVRGCALADALSILVHDCKNMSECASVSAEE